MKREWNHAVDAFWRRYCAQSGRDAPRRPFVFSFGESPQIADELALLVLQGTKRATACALFDYASSEGPVPRAGDLSIVVDGAGNPRCVIRTTEIRIGPLISADAAFAWDEGEGDRSLNFLLTMYRDLIGRRASRAGIPMHDDIDTVFERFTVAWPPEHADPTGAD